MSDNNSEANEIRVPAEYHIFFNFLKSKAEPWVLRINDMEKDIEISSELRVKILGHALERLKENATDLYRTSLPRLGFSGAPRYYALIVRDWKLYNIIGVRWNQIPTYWALYGGYYWAPAIAAKIVRIIERELERIDLEKAGFILVH
jgi:hypothetical protein